MGSIYYNYSLTFFKIPKTPSLFWELQLVVYAFIPVQPRSLPSEPFEDFPSTRRRSRLSVPAWRPMDTSWANKNKRAISSDLGNLRYSTLDIQDHHLRFGIWTPKTCKNNTPFWMSRDLTNKENQAGNFFFHRNSIPLGWCQLTWVTISPTLWRFLQWWALRDLKIVAQPLHILNSTEYCKQYHALFVLMVRMWNEDGLSIPTSMWRIHLISFDHQFHPPKNSQQMNQKRRETTQ